MTWNEEFLDEAKKDMKRLDHSEQIQVLKRIKKAANHPVSVYEGGCGKPLGHNGGTNLTNLLKIRFRDLGIRVVYKVEHSDTIMKIIVVSARTDDPVYKEAEKGNETIICKIESRSAGFLHHAQRNGQLWRIMNQEISIIRQK